MLGVFWIALELSNPMVGLITRLSLLLKNLTAFKIGEVAKSGNCGKLLLLGVKLHVTKVLPKNHDAKT